MGINASPSLSVPMRIEIQETNSVSSLQCVIRCMEEQKRCGATSNTAPYTVIEEISFYNGNSADLSADGFRILTELTDRGVAIDEVPEFNLVRTEENSHIVFKALRGILQPQQTDQHVGARSMRVSVDSHYWLECLSAVQHFQSLESLDVRLPDAQLSQADYRRIAYTIFSCYASHRLSSIQLGLASGFDDLVGAIKLVLHTDDDPTREIWGTGGTEATQQPRVDYIASTTFYHSQPTTTLSDPSLIKYTSKAPITVRTVEEMTIEGRKWWAVLLPGRGLAWVRDSDASPPRCRTPTTCPQFGTLHLSFSEEFPPAASLSRLLQLIGSGIHELAIGSISDDDIHIDADEILPAIFTACPRLKRLTLSADTITSSALNRLVQFAIDGSCQLEELNLWRVQVSDASEVELFFSALCDPRHPLTQRLRRLSLDFDVVEHIAEWAERLLHSNRSLSRITVSFGGALDSPIVQRLENLTEQEAASPIVALQPLTLKRKLAFLSVAGHPESEVAVGMQRLDTSVISNILQYAAFGRTREVSMLASH